MVGILCLRPVAYFNTAQGLGLGYQDARTPASTGYARELVYRIFMKAPKG
jgi:hypothetical protein